MLSRLKLPTMISIITVCFIAITAASLAYIVSGTLFEDAEHNAATREGFALRTAATLIEQRIHGTHVDWNGSTIRRIIVPDVSELGDNTLVDDVSRITGGAATLFVFNREKNDFVRVSTSVKKADGTRAIGTWLGNTGPVFPVVREGNTYAGEALILNIPYYTIYQPFYDPDGVVSGILFAGVQKSEVIETANQLVRSLILTSCGLVLVLSLCAYFAVRRITRPLLVLAFTINRITQNGAITVPYTNYRNEIGAIASAMKIFRETLLEANSLRVEQIDNEKKSELVRRDGMVSIAARIRKSVGVIVEQLKLLSHQAQDATVQMQGNADVATRRVERALFDLKNASSDVTLVATAVSELSASSNDISVRTSHTVVATRTALSSGHAAGEIATKLSQATHYIANISSLIGKIASQTNLLALNATIEAARAGEAGRGFAVVASEVKVLAEQTARATDDIDRHVAEIGQITASVVAAISEMNSSIDTATSTTVSIAAAVQEQSAATGDISQSIQRAAAGTLNVIEGIADLPELAHRIQDAAGSLCTVNDALGEQARLLSTEIDRLLQELTDCHVIERLEGSERAVARG